jgi:hypothetical protein
MCRHLCSVVYHVEPRSAESPLHYPLRVEWVSDAWYFKNALHLLKTLSEATEKVPLFTMPTNTNASAEHLRVDELQPSSDEDNELM